MLLCCYNLLSFKINKNIDIFLMHAILKWYHKFAKDLKIYLETYFIILIVWDKSLIPIIAICLPLHLKGSSKMLYHNRKCLNSPRKNDCCRTSIVHVLQILRSSVADCQIAIGSIYNAYDWNHLLHDSI